MVVVVAVVVAVVMVGAKKEASGLGGWFGLVWSGKQRELETDTVLLSKITRWRRKSKGRIGKIVRL